ncbi:MAG: SET domain-containing protein [Alphaproteobacteria bacterium]|nr:SET domain-containing protein [Alphaproteobacteria bacterium]
MSWSNFNLIEVLNISGEAGVFARKSIPEGAVVGVFDGVAEIFTVDGQGQVDWRGHDGGMSIHLKLSDGILYAIMPNLGVGTSGIDYINHSCKPNCRADAGLLVVETIKNINKGEQLTLNYHDMDIIKLGRKCWCEDVPENERCVL